MINESAFGNYSSTQQKDKEKLGKTTKNFFEIIVAPDFDKTFAIIKE